MNSSNTNFFEDNTSNNPLDGITEKELELIILKLGSFLSILENRKVNQAKLLINILKSDLFCNVCLKLSELDNNQLLIKNIVYKYPTLCKSKVIYRAINNARINKHRKKSV